MPSRIEALKSRCSNSFHHQKLAGRLTENEFDKMVEWLEDHDELAYLPFEYAVNRMFLDGRNKNFRPKVQSIVSELLLTANTCAHGLPRNREAV